MPLGDGIRRNAATMSQQERNHVRDAFVAFDTVKTYPDGVTFWDKQEQIHKAGHAAGQNVHDGPAFIPWHRELINRLEALLRQVDPLVSLPYWDWMTDPRSTAGGRANLMTAQFMGSASGNAGPPLAAFESTEGGGHTLIWRSMAAGAPPVSADAAIVGGTAALPHAQQFPAFQGLLQPAHNSAHGYIGGTISQQHFSFHDPMVFLLHSNMDRLWAMWQSDPAQVWRLDPAQVYGNNGSSPTIVGNLEPWAGQTPPLLRPWAPPDNQQQAKNSKDLTVVVPHLYDSTVNEQRNWRWCSKCQGMHFAGHPTKGVCPAGGPHIEAGSGNYTIVQNTPAYPGQTNWRWCSKCEGMHFSGNASQGPCPAGGQHIHTASGNYHLRSNLPAGAGQSNWRWCHKCQGLYFAGNATQGVCPGGGQHDHTGSGDYHLFSV